MLSRANGQVAEPRFCRLEIIVSTVEDAIEAEAGGADRLEVVRDLERGGLTPDSALVKQITEQVRIPIRVMLRENSSMQIKDEAELHQLKNLAAAMRDLPIEGFVAGFLDDNQLDVNSLRALVNSAPEKQFTFHRAFDELTFPMKAVIELKRLPQVNRVLTTGGEGSWLERKVRLQCWQQLAQPEILILAAAGLSLPILEELGKDPLIREVHIGRAARIPAEPGGRVSRARVAQLKGLLA